MIACIVPSRGRPENIQALMEAWEETRTGWSELHVVVDNDDPREFDYVKLKLPRWATLWVVERRRLGGTLNWLAPMLARQRPIVGFMGDDHRPRTKGWDEKIAQAINEKPGSVVYGNDLFQGRNLPTAVFEDSEIINAVGWMVLPGQIHLWMDNTWKTVGEQLGTLTYLPDVIIEHMHPQAGKAEWDDGYREVNGGDVWENDEKIYHEWVASQMDDDIQRMRSRIWG